MIGLLIQLQQTLIRRNSDVLKNDKLSKQVQAKYRAILHQDYQVLHMLMEIERHPDGFDWLVYSFSSVQSLVYLISYQQE